MSEITAIPEFKELLNKMAKGHVTIQTALVTVKSVDWSKKTMVATGVSDNLDYPDVRLGLGCEYRKPALKCNCLIGVIENLPNATFLIDAEKVEEFVYESGNSKLTMNKDGFVIERNGESLTQIIKDILSALMKSTYTNGAGTTSTPNNLTEFQGIDNRIGNLLK